ncbi:hypothetical protein ABIB57_005421 [Devosia sp. UYZn731]
MYIRHEFYWLLWSSVACIVISFAMAAVLIFLKFKAAMNPCALPVKVEPLRPLNSIMFSMTKRTKISGSHL